MVKEIWILEDKNGNATLTYEDDKLIYATFEKPLADRIAESWESTINGPYKVVKFIRVEKESPIANRYET